MSVPAQKPSTSQISLRHRPFPRTAQLLVGLVLFGVGEGLIMAAGLGVLPWDVLSQGLVRHFGLTVGAWSVIIGISVLLLWIPLRERPGVGTILNALIIGPVLDATLRVVGPPSVVEAQAVMLVAGVLLNGVASAVYIGARLGPGPRDGVMTALVRTTGRSVRLVRTSIEVAVVIVGFALGGNLGVGTLLYALAIGPIIHVTLPYVLARDGRPQAGS